MPTLYDQVERSSLLQRLGGLKTDSQPVWGRMSPSQVVCHLICAFRASLGELPVGPATGAMSHLPLNWLVIHLFSWPQAKAESPPEFLGLPPTGWEPDLATLRSLIERAAARGPTADWPPSRTFGRLSGASWGALHRKHLDHHLRQFGM